MPVPPRNFDATGGGLKSTQTIGEAAAVSLATRITAQNLMAASGRR